jgi:hypothetical protein
LVFGTGTAHSLSLMEPIRTTTRSDVAVDSPASSHRVFWSGVVSGSGGAFITAAATVLAVPILLTTLGPIRFGAWAALSVVITIAQLGNLGVTQAVIKLIASSSRHEGDYRACGFAAAGLQLACVPTIIIVAIMLRARDPLLRLLLGGALTTSEVRAAFIVTAVGGVLIVSLQALLATLCGLQQLALANALNVAASLASTLIGIVSVLRGGGIVGLAYANVVGPAAVLLVATPIVFRQLRGLRRSLCRLDVPAIAAVVRLSVPQLLGSLGGVVYVPMLKIAIANVGGLASVAAFEVATKATSQVRALFETGLRSLIPSIAAAIREHHVDAESIASIMATSRRIVTVGIVLCFVPMLVLSDWLLALWLRTGYVSGMAAVLRWCAAAQMASLVAVPAYYALIGAGDVASTAKSWGVLLVGTFGIVSIVIILRLSPTLIYVGMSVVQVVLCAYLWNAWTRQLRRLHEAKVLDVA